MPTIECLVKRTGPTPVALPEGAGKAAPPYIFYPHPFAKKGDPSTSICEVNKDTHLDWMLKKNPNTFREYDPERTRREVVENIRHPQPSFKGFSIQKYFDKGYIVADYRNTTAARYMDQRGEWKESRRDLEPFLSEIHAWEWLKTEIEMLTGEELPEPELLPEALSSEAASMKTMGRPRKV
jgi:hypothetical protein